MCMLYTHHTTIILILKIQSIFIYPPLSQKNLFTVELFKLCHALCSLVITQYFQTALFGQFLDKHQVFPTLSPHLSPT